MPSYINTIYSGTTANSTNSTNVYYNANTILYTTGKQMKYINNNWVFVEKPRPRDGKQFLLEFE